MSGYQIRKDAKFRQREDTPADIEWRKLQRAASEQAVSERKAKFPTITAENFDEASEFQERRTSELMRERTCDHCGAVIAEPVLCRECRR